MKKILCWMGLSLLLAGCSTYDEPMEAPVRAELASNAPQRDPNSMEVMRQAVDAVAHTNPPMHFVPAGTPLEPTHFYIRFMPATVAQFDALKENEWFKCFNFPLDQAATTGYRSSVPSDQPEPLYATVPFWLEMPDTIAWEKLQDLYDPRESPDGYRSPAWARAVQDQAMAIAYPGEFLPTAVPSRTVSGRIRVWDDRAYWNNPNDPYIPLEGVTIHIFGSFLGVYETKTKADGTFTYTFPDSRNSTVKCTLSFDDNKWFIKHDQGVSADITSAHLPANVWNLDIAQGSVDLGPATVFRGAYRWCYKLRAEGILPPDPGRKMRFHCFDSSSVSYTLNGRTRYGSGLFWPGVSGDANNPDIMIACRNTPSDVFGTTAHELGHADQYFHGNGRTATDFIQESWAEFMRYFAQEIEYKELGLYHKLHEWRSIRMGDRYIDILVPGRYNAQAWGQEPLNAPNPIYTPFFIDLFDDFDQYYWHSIVEGRTPPASLPNDWIGQNGEGAMTAPVLRAIAFGSNNRNAAYNLIRTVLESYDHRSYAEEMRRFRIAYDRLGSENND